ncbi:hypothetical protein LTR10_015071 [Elasticomyces elasticus]|uniref:Plastocyanin-like domain-containing protein n=1 Tax=Exophiala sideris TaxID=1016849 RepID=A0ABR0JSM5_9EURO|nr:hypothetical protein LTR10_015071 [Elasticomyces elasticus]KAK5034732.1 hypothetical protein LTR13_006389 [Exophiala sideris]KAK5039947.1 hypothetical protein LTS07_000442 [Exophiala sideris]KAK5068326.1 hypothetical protein LTR69_000444 [Exophiala sideris]KAK5187627.1 hypothetical protein LTR44_000443 [Eurotiomycetes sp. CCFEE 6388]
MERTNSRRRKPGGHNMNEATGQDGHVQEKPSPLHGKATSTSSHWRAKLAYVVLSLLVFGSLGTYLVGQWTSFSWKAGNHAKANFGYEQPEEGYHSPGDLRIILHPEDHVSRPPTTLTYSWIITKGYRSPDGVRKEVYLINDQLIGETTEARSGDRLIVNVTNHLTDEGLAMHWHGLRMAGANDMDGAERGMAYLGLQNLYDRAANGTLPMISYIIGPTELSEHPPYSPHDGAWLQEQVVNAVTKGKNWNSTALIISFDESGGWGDHVTPYHSPNGTAGEWLEDPYGLFGYTFSGPGYRLPFYIISPWTRGGHVFTEKADDNSQIMFVEKWLAAKGINAVTNQMPAWRRAHMSDLTAAFDFSSPNMSIPAIPVAPVPHKDNKTGVWDGSSYCEAQYAVQRPPVPYANQTEEKSLISEKGFKSVRGYLTEGRFLTFEAYGYALTNTGAKAAMYNATKAVASHDGTGQRWVIHETATDSRLYTISSAVHGRYIGPQLSLVTQKEALVHNITYLGGGKGYEVLNSNGKYITIDTNGTVAMATAGQGFTIYSVT